MSSVDPTPEQPMPNLNRTGWNGIKKKDLLTYISAGFASGWFIIGIPLSLYVRAQTEDVTCKSSYCQ